MSELIQMPANEKLIACRNAQDLTLAQVASKLNLPVSVILAIEEGRYESLHGEAFVFGVLRGYAGLVDIDPEALLESYKKESRSPIETSKNVDSVVINAHLSWRNLISVNTIAQHMKSRTAYGIAAVIVLALIIKVCSIRNDIFIENPVETSITIDTSMGTTIVRTLDVMPIVNPTQDFVPDVLMITAEQQENTVNTVSGFGQSIKSGDDKNIASLSFNFVADCWVEVLDGNNEKIFASMQTANKKLVLTGKPPFRITLGYAPGVKLSYNSQIVPINADSTHVAKLFLGNS